MDGNAKLGIDMSGRDLGISSGHDVRVDSDTHLGPWMGLSKLLQDGNIVNIDQCSDRVSLLIFLQRHTVGCEQDVARSKSGLDPKGYLLNGHTIQAGPPTVQQTEDLQIGIGFAGVVDPRVGNGEGVT